MNRRGLLLGGISVSVLWISGCGKSDPGHGPGRVHWDRDSCARCRIIVSDRRFAAQIRGGEKRQVFQFDDIGCAIFWLKENNPPWATAPDTEIWVADTQSGAWLDARTAHFVSGKTTPMLYGYGAVREPVSGSVDFATLKAAILAKGR